MTSKLKNIIIIAVVAVALILVYFFFIKKGPDEAALVSSSGSGNVSTTPIQDSAVTRDFLSLLLNVKNIKLDDSIFSDIAFTNLHDSSIILVPDGTEGRPNPFAPIGYDVPTAPVTSPTSPTSPITPTTPSQAPATAPATSPTTPTRVTP